MIPTAYLAAGTFAAGLALGAMANGWRLGLQLEKIATAAAEQKAENIATERLWADHTIKTVKAANAEAEKLRAALARAGDAGRGLHDARTRRTAEAASAPGTSEAAAATIRLLAELHRELDDFAGEAARAAGESRAAGLTCIRADEVTR